MNSHTIFLAGAADGGTPQAHDALPRGRRAARLRFARDFIQQHLTEAGLNAERLGKELGVSSRAVQLLFEAEGSTLSAYVLEQRLLRAFQHLRDPRYDLTAISQIAYSAGFVDLSHFNRCFRKRFGHTPSRVRDKAA